MTTIEFNKQENKHIIKTEKFPSLLIDVLNFETTDDKWAFRISCSYLQISFSCYDENNILLGKMSQPLNPLVSPYQVKPNILFNHYPIRFDINRLFINKLQISRYEIEIELFGIQFTEIEKYNLQLHLLEHSNYQILCQGETIGTLFITDNHPQTNQRNITLIPVVTREHSDRNKTLEFNNHINYQEQNNKSDQQIIDELFSKNLLKCSENYTIIKI